MTLPLSKTLDPADFDQLPEELTIVDQHFTSAREQHPMRRWEYAMALRAYDTWAQQDHEHYGHANRTHGGYIYDVGGAGSPFYHMAGSDQTRVIDPDENQRLDQFIRYARLGSAVFCLSVLEHVDDLDQFLYHLSCLVAPGGLLFLTMDYADGTGPDTCHFHWMRKRIVRLDDWGGLVHTFVRRDFDLLGEFDPTFHGPQVYDYSFASLALVKKP